MRKNICMIILNKISLIERDSDNAGNDLLFFVNFLKTASAISRNQYELTNFDIINAGISHKKLNVYVNICWRINNGRDDDDESKPANV